MKKLKQLVALEIIDELNSGIGDNWEGRDLQEILFSNEHAVSADEAKLWFKKNMCVFEAIRLIQDYKNQTYGGGIPAHAPLDDIDYYRANEVYTQVRFIIGEKVLMKLATLHRFSRTILKEAEVEAIISDIQQTWLAA